MSSSPPLDTPDILPETEPTITDEANPQTDNATPEDTRDVKQAIDFLEALEEQSRSQNGVNTDGGTGDSTSKLTQDEMFQLVREGVSYYDSLVDSGSVDFFMQIISHSSPGDGMRQVPNGTWEGTFAFSGNRVAGSVTENATEYNDLC